MGPFGEKCGDDGYKAAERHKEEEEETSKIGRAPVPWRGGEWQQFQLI